MQGYRVGATVKDCHGAMFVINSISETGSVKMTTIDANGNKAAEIEVAYKDFAAYQLTNKTIETLAEWEKISYAKSATFAESSAKSLITIAFEAANENVSRIRVQTKPAKAIFSESAVAAGKLALIPLTPKIVVTKTVVPGGLEINSPFDIGDKKIYLQAYTNEKEVVPYWFARIVDDEKEATMVEKTRIVEIKRGVSKKEAETVSVAIPVMINKKAIKAGEELTVYRAPIEKTQKMFVPKELGAAPKAPKIK